MPILIHNSAHDICHSLFELFEGIVGFGSEVDGLGSDGVGFGGDFEGVPVLVLALEGGLHAGLEAATKGGEFEVDAVGGGAVG